MVKNATVIEVVFSKLGAVNVIVGFPHFEAACEQREYHPLCLPSFFPLSSAKNSSRQGRQKRLQYQPIKGWST